MAASVSRRPGDEHHERVVQARRSPAILAHPESAPFAAVAGPETGVVVKANALPHTLSSLAEFQVPGEHMQGLPLGTCCDPEPPAAVSESGASYT